MVLGERSADSAAILLERGGGGGERQPAVGRRSLTLAHELAHYMFADKNLTDWSVVNSPARHSCSE